MYQLGGRMYLIRVRFVNGVTSQSKMSVDGEEILM